MSQAAALAGRWIDRGEGLAYHDRVSEERQTTAKSEGRLMDDATSLPDDRPIRDGRCDDDRLGCVLLSFNSLDSISISFENSLVAAGFPLRIVSHPDRSSPTHAPSSPGLTPHLPLPFSSSYYDAAPFFLRHSHFWFCGKTQKWLASCLSLKSPSLSAHLKVLTVAAA